jgi:hypothetical protein
VKSDRMRDGCSPAARVATVSTAVFTCRLPSSCGSPPNLRLPVCPAQKPGKNSAIRGRGKGFRWVIAHRG